MKKIILCMAAVAAVVSCKKVAAGGNKGVIKIEDGVQRYSDDMHRQVLQPVQATAAPTQNAAVNVNGTDSTTVKPAGTPAPSNGTETTVNTLSAPVNNGTKNNK